MPTFEAAVDNIISSDAEFQAFCQAVEAGVLASGFLEVAPDTGQLNLATAVRPGLGAFAGYRIYRAKDALSATKPLYIKLEFGASSGAVDRPTIRRQVGVATNGAGTLTGPFTTQQNTAPSSAGSGTMTMLGGGGDHAMFLYFHDAGNAVYNMFWAVGRFLNQDDGAADDPLLWELFHQSSSFVVGSSFQWSDGAAAWANATSGFSYHVPDLGHPIHSGGNVNDVLLFQALLYRNAKTYAFPLLAGKASELPLTTPESSKFNLNVWGENHTFLPIPFPALASGGGRIAFLWED